MTARRASSGRKKPRLLSGHGRINHQSIFAYFPEKIKHGFRGGARMGLSTVSTMAEFTACGKKKPSRRKEYMLAGKKLYRSFPPKTASYPQPFFRFLSYLFGGISKNGLPFTGRGERTAGADFPPTTPDGAERRCPRGSRKFGQPPFYAAKKGRFERKNALRPAG